MTAATIWTFRTRHFTVVVDCDYEDYPDLSWDETGEVLEKLESGEWGNYTMRARVIGPNGEELSADYLGNSIYADPREFRDHVGSQGKYGSYFADMVHTVVTEARSALRSAQSVYVRENA